MKTKTFNIRGMTCSGCERSVESAVLAVDGVESAEASYSDATVRVEADSEVTDQALSEAVSAAGYLLHTASRPSSDGTPLGDVPSSSEADVSNGDGFGLVVLGGGSAGFAAAIRAAEEGVRVALINSGRIGGTCVNVGCIPSKALIRAGAAHHGRSHHAFDGIAAEEGDLDWNAVRTQKDDLVETLRQSKYLDVLGSYPTVSLFEQQARLEPGGGVRLEDGTLISAPRVVLTTGASPLIPDIPGLSEVDYLDSTSIMALTDLPSSLIVLGAGSVGLELAQAYARFGVDVTIVSRSPRVLSKEDPDLGTDLMDYLRREGITIHAGLAITRIEKEGDDHVVHFENNEGEARSVTASQLLVAVGRRPNTTGLGLEEAGVSVGPGGEIVVNEFLQTSNPHVYAAGDVTGEPMHVYVAAQDAATAAGNALHGNTQAVDRRVIPQVVFTDPAVAFVGLTADEAGAQGIEAITSLLPLKHVPRALTARDTRGFIKLVADSASRRIIGAQILASEAGEMIMEPALAVKFSLTIEDLASTLHPYLTLAEGVKLAAQTFDKNVAELSCCAA